MATSKDLTSGDTQLELDAAEVLRGTQDLRRRLLLALSTGTPSVLDLAYALKVRVKDDYKIIDKVKRKRNEKDPEYNVEKIRDIVGARIVTLYRLEALTIIPLLLDVIFDNAGNDPASIFLRDPVEEIIIYSTNPTGDAQNLVGRLKPLFASKGLLDKVQTDEMPSNYSSIHLVVWGRGKYRGTTRPIPVEIQVRTAFEDAWGEIDHRLKYKPAADVTPDEEASTANILAHLNVMKTMIDGLAQYADQIKIQIDEPHEKRLRSIKSKLAEGPMERLSHVTGIPADLLERIRSAVGLSRLAFEASEADTGSFADQVSSHRRAVEELLSARAAVEGDEELTPDQKSEIIYVLDMERALLLFEYGNKLQGSAGNEALVEASRIYTDIEPKFPDRGIVKYRLAKVFDALGDVAATTNKLEELNRNIDQTDLGVGHWVRAAAPRFLGVVYWEQALRIKDLAGGMPDELQKQRVTDLLGKAYEVTRPILVVSDTATVDQSEHLKALNNLLFFAMELVAQHGKDVDLPQFGYSKGELDRLITEFEGATDGSDFRHVHTLMRAYALIGRMDDARTAAETVKDMLEEMGVVDRGGNGREQVMLREARMVLNGDYPTK